jgi:hypothetical protein
MMGIGVGGVALGILYFAFRGGCAVGWLCFSVEGLGWARYALLCRVYRSIFFL